MRASSGTAAQKGRLAGEVARSLGIGVQTLHYYEREGLIPPPRRTEAGYRLYTEELVGRVRFIRKAQALGLPLEEIREVFSLSERGSSPCGRVQAALAAKLAEVDERLRELRGFRDELARLIRQAPAFERAGGTAVCAIVEEAPGPAHPRAAALLPPPRRSAPGCGTRPDRRASLPRGPRASSRKRGGSAPFPHEAG